MENKDKPAMPIHPQHVMDGNSGLGLTKREYFAAMAMQGIVSTIGGTCSIGKNDAEAIAKEAVTCADALLNQLEK